MKRILLISAGVAALVTTGAGIMLQQQASKAGALALANLRQTGLTVEMSQPLQWQFLPLGLKSGALVLKAANGETILSAPSVFLALGPADIFSARAGELRLQDASFIYRRAADGSSNWDALLNDEHPAALRSLAAENSSLELWGAGAEKPLEISIKQIRFENMGSASSPLQADFLLSLQNAQGENLLLENSLNAEIKPQADKSWLVQGVALNSTVSSTSLPGTFIFQSNGDIRLMPEGLQSEALKIQASYKAPGMTDATASISTAIKTDWQADTLSLQKLSLSSGNKQWQLDGDLKANLAEKSLHAEKLVIRYSTSDKPAARELGISNLLLSASGEASQPQISLSGSIGEGQFRIPLQAKLTPASADIKASLSASNIDIKNLRSWLDDKEATGRLDMEAQLEAGGQSWEALQQQATGNLKLTLQNGFLGSISIMSVLRERLQGYASLLPELAPAAGNEKGTALRRLEMQLSLKEGVVSTEKFRADIDLAHVAASGRYDSKSGLIDYQGKLDLDRRLFTGKNGLELPLLCQGNIKEEQVDFLGGLETDCKVDEKAKQDLLARALINRFRS